jgi:hypothetical protein
MVNRVRKIKIYRDKVKDNNEQVVFILTFTLLQNANSFW